MRIDAGEFGGMLTAATDRWRKVVELSGVRKDECRFARRPIVPGEQSPAASRFACGARAAAAR